MSSKSQIDQLWMERIGQPIDFRIGICSGIASVGNTGSTRRLKYGPLGNTVNLASRLQSAAKQFGVKQLISEETHRQLLNSTAPAGLLFRSLGTAQFVNIAEPIGVYEPIWIDDASEANSIVRSYDNAIAHLARGEKEEATTILMALQNELPNDLPTNILIRRLQDAELDPNCLWPLDRK